MSETDMRRISGQVRLDCAHVVCAEHGQHHRASPGIISLCASYSMSDTCIRYPCRGLRGCVSVSGTGLGGPVLVCGNDVFCVSVSGPGEHECVSLFVS
eukprot:2636015-Rhodomonas_salina.1